MQCPFCHNFRPANNAPCPSCNAPSPLGTEAWNGQSAFFPDNQNQAGWGNSEVTQNNWGSPSAGQAAFPSLQQNFGGSGIQQNFGGSGIQQNFGGSGAQQNFGGSGVQQAAFPQEQGFPDGGDGSFWSQNRTTREARNAGQPQSLLPVPYDGGPGTGLAALPTAFPTISPNIPQVNSLLPALPDSEQEAPVYVGPMYTKPRPIIPRYRAISGLLSMVIVLSLLCGGSIYYGQVTGKFTVFQKLFGTYAPPPVSATQKMLLIPSNKVQYTTSPAAKIIDSVGISNHVDAKGHFSKLINQFTVGDAIYIVVGATVPKKAGTYTISIKWYSNSNYYRTSVSDPITKPNQTVSATFSTVYGLPAEGKAEVYWNNVLAASVLFVVEPVAA